MSELQPLFDSNGNPLCRICFSVLQQDPENMYEFWCPECNKRRGVLVKMGGEVELGSEVKLVSKYLFEIVVLDNGNVEPFGLTCKTTQTLCEDMTEKELAWHEETMRLFIGGMDYAVEANGHVFLDPLSHLPLNSSDCRKFELEKILASYLSGDKIGRAVVNIENYSNRNARGCTQKVVTLCNNVNKAVAQGIANQLAQDSEIGMHRILEDMEAGGDINSLRSTRHKSDEENSSDKKVP